MYAEGTNTPLEVILKQVSWYWFTKSYGRALWAYRAGWEAILRDVPDKLPSPLAVTNKPIGYSFFPAEVLAVAKSWLDHWFPENLVFYRAHDRVRQLCELNRSCGLTKNRVVILRLLNYPRCFGRMWRTSSPLSRLRLTFKGRGIDERGRLAVG
jgi:hypothetical protein